jgi:hypothetical protein
MGTRPKTVSRLSGALPTSSERLHVLYPVCTYAPGVDEWACDNMGLFDPSHLLLCVSWVGRPMGDMQELDSQPFQ